MKLSVCITSFTSFLLMISCNNEESNHVQSNTTTTKTTFSINGVEMDSIVGEKAANMNDGMWEYYSKGQLMRKTLFDQGKEVYFIENGDTARGAFFEEYKDQFPTL